MEDYTTRMLIGLLFISVAIGYLVSQYYGYLTFGIGIFMMGAVGWTLSYLDKRKK